MQGEVSEMLKCPWCHSDQTIAFPDGVQCCTCGGSGPVPRDPYIGGEREAKAVAEGIAAWNRRSLPAAVEVVREALRNPGAYHAVECTVWSYLTPQSEEICRRVVFDVLDTLSVSCSPKSPSSAITEPETEDEPVGAVSAPVRGKA